MSKPDPRTFSLEFKLAALDRLAGGETIAALSVEFGVHRQALYKWRDLHRAGRLGARRGRPTKLEGLARDAAGQKLSELEAARQRVAELSARLVARSSNWIFFKEPCGASRRHASPAEGLARRDLHGSPSDDASARRNRPRTWSERGAAVPGRSGEPGKLLSTLERRRARARGDGGA